MLAEDYITRHPDEFNHKGEGQYVYSGGGNAAIPDDGDNGDDDKMTFTLNSGPEGVESDD
jgi:hypothetical protein